MTTTKPSAYEPALPPMHHASEDADGGFRLDETSCLPTPPMYRARILEGSTRNV
ncbi:hypothetical protein SAMN05892883_2815 [Jatrophihabitans sp. GAS493]|uniref:hypothetical protein n=1 Tax=Jatrophihabitans sp. GAS493 TaxID=1907575 RepID=UPI000BC063F4|nr:hypothetical protein [Jatrophihabitans sp. GAS493]SOD73524.1 hypothetical protein SAMN05892883_2815 [Jatrophihabitans sp. GAS493]